MSNTFHLVCDDCKEEVWIGQGWGFADAYLYEGKKHLHKLERFLAKHGSDDEGIVHHLRYLYEGLSDEYYDEFEPEVDKRR